MTNPAAMISLLCDGEDVQWADFGVFLQIVGGLEEAPTVRGTDLVVPSLAGRIPYGREDDTLRLLLAGIVTGTGASLAAVNADYFANADWVRTLFRPNKDPFEIEATLPGGTVKTINARPLNLIWGKEFPGEYSTVTIELESVDPDWVTSASS